MLYGFESVYVSVVLTDVHMFKCLNSTLEYQASCSALQVAGKLEWSHCASALFLYFVGACNHQHAGPQVHQCELR